MNRYRISACLVFAGLLGMPLVGRALESSQTSESSSQDPWSFLKRLVGSWEGTGEGNSGTSRIERHYEFILQGGYVLARTKAVFAPQEKNPKGESHEDLGVFSYDQGRKKLVLREFHVEGFVNQYVCEVESENSAKLVCTTEKVENGPPRLRARLIIQIESDDAITETFELAFSGKDFAPCSSSRLHRSK